MSTVKEHWTEYRRSVLHTLRDRPEEVYCRYSAYMAGAAAMYEAFISALNTDAKDEEDVALRVAEIGSELRTAVRDLANGVTTPKDFSRSIDKTH